MGFNSAFKGLTEQGSVYISQIDITANTWGTFMHSCLCLLSGTTPDLSLTFYAIPQFLNIGHK